MGPGINTAETTFDPISLQSETGVHLRVPEVLSSEDFGEAMARGRQRWDADQGERKRSRDAFNSFVHACLGHRTLARAIVQFGFSSRQQFITALRRAEDGAWHSGRRKRETQCRFWRRISGTAGTAEPPEACRTFCLCSFQGILLHIWHDMSGCCGAV